jgi:hypothetical protein
MTQSPVSLAGSGFQNNEKNKITYSVAGLAATGIGEAQARPESEAKITNID